MTRTSTSRHGSPLRFPAHAAPVRAGAGLKPEHIEAILAERNAAGFFEVHAENYMGGGGPPHAALTAVRERYPVSVHGVGLSLGGSGDLDKDHLNRLADVVSRYEPFLVSEHLAWSTHDTVYYNDLLPVPYTQETLARVCDHIDEVQTQLKQPMLLENPSTYVAFQNSEMPETSFIEQIARRTGCGLLLDLNNVLVSATNHGYSPEAYLEAFPLEHVREIHLAGHAQDQDDAGKPLLIDSHDREVSARVWQLYRWVLERNGYITTLIEWDNDVPAWAVLKSEAAAADKIAAEAGAARFKNAS